MKVDYYLPPSALGVAADRGEWAARIGYDGFFTADTGHEPFLPIAAAAGRAPNLDYGTAIAVAFARSPMVTAMTGWDLASLTGGKFLMGLGTQIKPHITRRFSMEWSAPGPRMREYIAAVRTIWDCWQNGTKLSFQGDHYQFSLMTPFFDPGPIEHPDVPIYIAGVGPYMAGLAGEACDGYHAHPFHTVRYLREVTFPAMDAGAAKTGRSRADVDMVCTVFVITGRDDAEMSAMEESVRQQVAFYASTPAYRPVLETHGWEFGETLTAMSKRGEWQQMAEVIPDEVLDEIAVRAPIDELGAALKDRYDGVLDRVGLYSLDGVLQGLPDDALAALVAAAK